MRSPPPTSWSVRWWKPPFDTSYSERPRDRTAAGNVAANPERLRFYVDESTLGLGKALAAAREDVVHAGHPLVPECPVGALDP